MLMLALLLLILLKDIAGFSKYRLPFSRLKLFACEDILACPESLEPLKFVSKYYGFLEEKSLQTAGGDRKYPVTKTYIDLSPTGDQKPIWESNIREVIGQRFFQNPIISGIYERGYRQNFERAGFPGPEKEFVEIDEFFTSANASSVFDLSCGPGFMARKLTASGNYQRIIAGDLSPNMLAETKKRFLNERLPLPLILRVDAAALPLTSGSVDAVHAGAAMHCWPKISQVLREVYRVLKPGGVFYASTFFTTIAIPKNQRENTGFYYFESEAEIRDFLEGAGFGGDTGVVEVRREGRGCAIVKAVKGDVPEQCKKFFPSINQVKETVTSGSNASD